MPTSNKSCGAEESSAPGAPPGAVTSIAMFTFCDPDGNRLYVAESV